MPSTQLETGNPKLETDLRELAQDIVRRAMNGGATAAECVVREGDEFSTLVRLGQVETLKESGSRSIGVRVFNGQRAASTYSSDFSRASLDRMVKSALELSKITSEDPFGGIPEAVATRLAHRRSRSLSRRRLFAARPRSYRLRPPRRKSRARLRSAHQEFRRRIVRRRHRPQSSGQLARLRRRIPPVVLLRGRRSHRANRRRRDAARLLVLGRAHAEQTRIARAGWQSRGRAHAAPPGRAQGKDRASSDHLRSHGRDLNPRAYFRRRLTATRSTAALRFSPASWDRKSPATTSPSSMTAPSPAASAPAPSMAKACPRAERW